MEEKKNYNSPLNLMAGRLGMHYRGVGDNNINEEKIHSILDPDVVGVENQAGLLHYNGGFSQQSRMIFDKLRTLDRVVKYSYQGADIKKAEEEEFPPVRGLINPNKVKQDYDDKILSIRWEYNIGCGDVIEWVGTKTHWIVYLQDLTELAYFRGDIRKCSYMLNIQDEDGVHSVYAALTGPQEKNIKSIKYNGISQDVHNNTISFYVPKNEHTINFFNRNKQNNGETYKHFILTPLLDEDIVPYSVWHVEDADWLSMPGVIRVTASECPENEALIDIDNFLVKIDKTDMTESVDDYNATEVERVIVGDTFIKPMLTYEYTLETEAATGVFSVVGDKAPVEIVEQDRNHIVLKWTHARSGQFKLCYTKNKTVNGKVVPTITEKTIVVETLY